MRRISARKVGGAGIPRRSGVSCRMCHCDRRRRQMPRLREDRDRASRRVTGEDVVAIFGRLVTGKQALCTASLAGLPSLKSAKPQPPVAAYFFESFTMN